MPRRLLYFLCIAFLLLLACQIYFIKYNPPGENNHIKNQVKVIKVPQVNSSGFIIKNAKDIKSKSRNEDMKFESPADIDEGWYSTVMENIKKHEYDINYQPSASAYESPNRVQNLRFTYMKDGFSARPRAGSIIQKEMTISSGNTEYTKPENWKITMKIAGYGKGTADKKFTGGDLVVKGNKAHAEDESFKTEYENTEAGMRQNFIVKQKPDGDGFLKVALNIETNLEVLTSAEGIVFKESNNNEKMKYNNLKVFDASGKKLNAGFEKGTGNEILIAVNDAGAVYPVTIDPLSSTENWTAESNQIEANFGSSVATAGDVNGDGFSDVIVGARYYDNGQTNEGRAFIFHGSPTGLSATANRTLESNDLGAYFGNSVSTAGDVNGDGYSDVIVGAYMGNLLDGRVYVYHGSSSGISATANWTKLSEQSYARFGYSVSTAGDVNGDGYSDVIVGAIQYTNGQSGEGKAYVYHGSSSGLSASVNWTVESNQANAELGNSVSTAGDVNGDGYSDVIVGAYGIDRAYVYHGSSSGLSATPNRTFAVAQVSSHFGYSVSTAGDVNGDGYSDVIVGGIKWDGGEADEGRAFVYHGSAAGLSGSVNWVAECNLTNAQFGYSVSSAGDVNGDGYADVIVGSPQYSNGQLNEGRAYLYHGSSSGLSSTESWIAEYNQVNAYFGYSVATAGDVNGDGFSDVIVGSPYFFNGESNEGRAYVYNGSPSGLSAASNWSAESDQASSRFGYSVSTAGDVNGDGHSDVIVSAVFYDNGESDEGRAYVYHGSSSGLSSTAEWTAEPNLITANFGWSVSTAGDVNGDGYSDVIIGSYNYDNVESNEGRAYVYHGSSSGLSATPNWTAESNQAEARFGWAVSTAGDVNGDGYSDVIIGSYLYDGGETDEGRAFVYHGSAAGLSASADWTAEPNQANAYFGNSVSSAGDVNGDGFSDVIVGCYRYDNGQSNEGRAYVYYGGSSGLSAAPNWNAESNQATAYFGYSVSTAGDVNRDGYSDVIVGASNYDNTEIDEGKVYVYHGSSSGLSAVESWSVESNQASAGFGSIVSSAGDVNGDGYSDVIVGAYSYDNAETNEGRTFVFHGSSSGLSAAADWTAESNQADARFGYSVSAAGDVNGDGYSDVIVGASMYDGGQSDEGRAFTFYGNSGGVALSPKQYRPDLITPVTAPLKTRSSSQAGLGLTGKTFFGRNDVKIQFEVKSLGTAFNGTGLTETGSWTDVGAAGTHITQLINGLSDRVMYKWRARIKYRLSDGAPQPFSRWIYSNTNGGLGEADFQVSDDNAPLPVELISFIAVCDNNTIKLNWKTATEINNYGFEVERQVMSMENGAGRQKSEDGDQWEKIGFVEGGGNSNSPKEYSFTDESAGTRLSADMPGILQYRLKQIDNDGKFAYSDEVEVNVGLWGIPTKFSLSQNYPNPFNPETVISYQLPITGHIELRIYDILGNEVATLVNEEKAPGYYQVIFNASNLSSGVYIYKLSGTGSTVSFNSTKKLMLMK